MNEPNKSISKDVKEKLEVSSVHLVRLGAENLPGGMASGLLIYYKGSRHLCTAAHAINKGPLSLQLDWDPQRRETNTRPLNLTAICSKQIASAADVDGAPWTDLDFAFCKILPDDVPLHQELDKDTLSGAIRTSRPCTIYKDTDIQEPSPDREYGFAGQTMMRYEDHSSRVQDVKFLATVLRVVYPLKYIGEHKGFYAFQFPGVHPGHKYFRGCSGAPIVDMDGHVVALVCWGSEEAPVIFGFPINNFKAVLEVSASGILDSIL